MSVVLRSYRNVGSVPIEICEVGKPIKARVRVDPGETSPLVRVDEAWHRFITEQTGFAIQMDEQVQEDETPEGYVNIMTIGDRTPKYRPMTPEERQAAGLPEIVRNFEPLPAVVVKPNVTAARQVPAPSAPPAPTAPAAPAVPAAAKPAVVPAAAPAVVPEPPK
jgi:hypothetical protein